MNSMRNDAVMQENNLPPTVGREANLEREKTISEHRERLETVRGHGQRRR